MLIGNTALELVDICPVPLVTMQSNRPALRRVLVCTRGSDTARASVTLAAQPASQASASLTVLHVMSQVDLTPSTPSPELEESAAWHLEHGTDEGGYL